MSVIASLFGRRPSRERPNLPAWIDAAASVLVVDGSGPGVEGAQMMFPGCTVLRHETTGVPGLPFHFPDPRRLPAEHSGRFGAVVLAEVLDKVIDVAFAVEEAMRAVARDGVLVVVQSVAPEDFEQRAVWNAAARMRDARHTSTPSTRQLTALYSGLPLELVQEAAWEEAVDRKATSRPDVAHLLARLLDAAATRGAAEVVQGDVIVVVRRASLLRRV